MIPLRDSTRSKTSPVVTITLIVLNLLIFLYQSTLTPLELNIFIKQYALIPGALMDNLGSFSLSGLFYAPLITSFFLHGSWFHVLSNMLYLWIFGDNIEDTLGRFRFILFYLLAGILANLAHVLTDVNSAIPLVGASGAIAGILGAYFITFPRARVTSVIFIFIFFTIRDIPAIYFLLFWFVLQIFNGLSSIGSTGATVAWWAHIGGFISGVVLMLLLKKNRVSNPY